MAGREASVAMAVAMAMAMAMPVSPHAAC